MESPFDPERPYGEHSSLVRTLEQALLSFFEDGADDADPAEKLELEVRVGTRGPSGFSPGLSYEKYDLIMKRLLKRLKKPWYRFRTHNRSVGFTDPPSDFVDVAFEGDWRVTLNLQRRKVVEIIKKNSFLTKDFVVGNQALPDLRVSMATETSMFSGDSQFKKLSKIALEACCSSGGDDGTNDDDDESLESVVGEIARGAAATLKAGINPSLITLAPGDLTSNKPDPIRSSTPDPSMLFKKLVQLEWTAVTPESLNALESRGSLKLSDSKLPVNNANFKLQFTNLPGRYKHAGGFVPVPLARYTINAPLCAMRISQPSAKESTNNKTTPIRLFRRKKRWSFLMGNGLKLDCTQIQSSKTFKDLRSKNRTYEMEIEWLHPDCGLKKKNLPEAVSRTVSELLVCFFDLPPVRVPSDFQWLSEPTINFRKRSRQAQIVEESRSTYSKLKRTDVRDRSNSRIFHLKNLNNFVKARLISSCVNECGSSLGKVLDLACGKGGDFAKLGKSYLDANKVLSEYVGIDVADGSLEDFKSRLESGMAQKYPQTKTTLINADLTSTDLSDNSSSVRVLNASGIWKTQPSSFHLKKCDFDVVSIQFALHYLFNSEESSMKFFSNVSSMLRPGGKFVATTVDFDRIVAELFGQQQSVDRKKSTKIEIKDFDESALCVATFPGKTINKLISAENTLFGLEYKFRLSDRPDVKAVDATEYLVPLQALKKVAKANGLILETHVSLLEYALSDLDPELFKAFGVPDGRGKMSDVERSIASLYVVVEMRKPQINEEDFVAKLIELSSSVRGWADLPSEEQTRLVNVACCR